MTTSDPDKKPRTFQLWRFIAKPNLGSASDTQHHLRAFLVLAGNVLLYYAVLSIEGTHKVKDTIRRLLQTVKIMDLTKDPNFETKELVDVVKGDPAIVAKLLKYVNSSFVSMRERTNSIERAVLHLGPSTLKTIVLAFSLVSANRKGSCSAFDYKKFWTESMARAAAARHLTSCCRLGIAPDDAFAAGLLCQLGRLAFATALPDQYANVLRRTGIAGPRRLSELERQEFGIDHRELAAEMMADWGMSRFFWQGTLFQGNLANEQILPLRSRERGLAMILSWAETIWIAMTANDTPLEQNLQETVIRQAEELGIAREDFPETFDETLEEWCELGEVLEVATFAVPPWAELAG